MYVYFGLNVDYITVNIVDNINKHMIIATIRRISAIDVPYSPILMSFFLVDNVCPSL